MSDPLARFARAPPHEGEITLHIFPLVRGKPPKAAGGRSHSVSKLELSNTPCRDGLCRPREQKLGIDHVERPPENERLSYFLRSAGQFEIRVKGSKEVRGSVGDCNAPEMTRVRRRFPSLDTSY